MANKEMQTNKEAIIPNSDKDYDALLHNINEIWDNAKNKAVLAVNTELFDANWETGRYIVEYEQGGKNRARYGDGVILRLSKDLTRRRGKGFSKYNLVFMRKLYIAFPKGGMLSHLLT